MAVYSIVDLEKLTGVKAHTIRIWEQRYGVITPKRTQSNIRYYQDDDLKQLLNIAILNKNGHKISRIAQMQPDEINETAAALSSIDVSYGAHLDALTIAMIEMDEIELTHEQKCLVNGHAYMIGWEVAERDVQSHGVDYAKAELEYYRLSVDLIIFIIVIFLRK